MNLKDLSDFGGQISRKISKIHFIFFKRKLNFLVY